MQHGDRPDQDQPAQDPSAQDQSAQDQSAQDQSAPDQSAQAGPEVEGEADASSPAPPPRAPLLPPRLFVVVALGLAVLAAEPTADLPYTLWGPSQPVDIGEPGDYRLDDVPSGSYVSVKALLSDRYGRYSDGGVDYEVRPVLGTALLVRGYPRQDALGKGVVELRACTGRLVRLGLSSAGFIERLLQPTSRYNNIGLQFDAQGALPPGRTPLLLLEGDVPRVRAWPIIWPLLLWAGVLVSLYGAMRSARQRRRRRDALEALARAERREEWRRQAQQDGST